MTTTTPADDPRRDRARVRPVRGAEQVHGVTFDGTHVWFASGDELHALDPQSGRIVRTLEVAGARRHRVRRPPPLPARRRPHPEDRSADRPGRRHHPRARKGGDDAGLTWAEGTLWVGQYPRPQDPPDRPRDRRDPAHDRVESLRHRRDLGRRRAVARHRRGRSRAAPRRSRERRGAGAGSRCPKARPVSGLESDGKELFFCGGGRSGRVRVVRRG